MVYSPNEENADENGCVTLVGAGSVCTYCGNDICGEGENRCNCPQDCLEENTVEEKYQKILEDIQEGNEYGIANNVSDYCFPWRYFEKSCYYNLDKNYVFFIGSNLSEFSREQRLNICYELSHPGSVADCLKRINESEECLNYANSDEYLTALCNLQIGRTLAYPNQPGIPAEVKTYPLVRFA